MQKESTETLDASERTQILSAVTAEIEKKEKNKGYIKSILSMVIFGLCYGYLTKMWWLGVGLTGLVLVHEMGHYWAAQLKSVKVSLPFFMPFVGAFINLKEKIESRTDEAFMAFGGPLMGALAALVCLSVWWMGGSIEWMVLGYIGLFFNLFNLFPFSPLDGGRITQVLTPAVAWIGLVGFIGYAFYGTTWSLIYPIILMAAVESLRGITHKKKLLIVYGVSMTAVILSIVNTTMEEAYWSLPFTLLYCGIFIYSNNQEYNKRKKNGTDHDLISDPRPSPSLKAKVLWSAAYVILAAILLTGVILLDPQFEAFFKTIK